MLSPVAVGVDGSPESLAAAEWAACEAVRRGRPLRLLHVRNWHPRQGGAEISYAAERHRARCVLRQAEERVRTACPDVRVYDERVEGPASAALVKASAGAELLVLGSRGLGGITGLLVGSVALEVVARATGAVVLVRADGTAGETQEVAGGGRRDVVVGVDVTEPCDEVIEFAFEAARVRHARLRVLHAWRAPDLLTLGPGEIGLVSDRERAEEWLRFLAAVLQPWGDKYSDVDVLETVVEGKPSGALLKAASGAELLVVGHRLTDRPRIARTGPVTHAVIQQAVCPVAVIPHY
ncbi:MULTISPECIES: universal stress protein [Streptomyces]|nr:MULTISPECIES: universal stress protein [Streptomyces]MBA8976699.1 nucleotide-binding universal stress UspA family protein [Streptomyces calvus]MYS29196.1 universal stress protein [Streptomyces sp. SID7804]